VVHRDISPRNILVNKEGDIVLADFGQSRFFGSPKRKLSQGVCTIFYRAPELLFGATYYSSQVDMWAIGCVFYELMKRKPLFSGHSEIEMLTKIFGICGEANEETWPGVS